VRRFVACRSFVCHRRSRAVTRHRTAQIPAMHRVRIFGINRTVGIDDEKRE
jgi:hypothetical protein